MANSNLTLEEIELSTDIYDPQTQSELIKAIPEYPLPQIVKTVIKIDQKRRNIQYGLWRRLKLEKASKDEWDDARQADGVPIFARKPQNVTKINYKSHTAFDRIIVSQNANYFIGKKPEITEDPVLDEWIVRNSFYTILNELGQDAAGQGEGLTLLYSPEGDSDLYITREYSYNGIVLYNQDTMEPEYGMLYYIRSDREYVVYWYTKDSVTKLEGQKDQYRITEEAKPHLIDGVPLIDWQNNSERVADTEPVINDMDLYDKTKSDFLSELGQLRMAYLLLKGMGLSGESTTENIFDNASKAPGFEGLAKTGNGLVPLLQQAGAFTSDNPDADVKFVTKDIASQAVEFALADLRQTIFQMANSYDPVTIQGAGGDITAFQIRMKLFPLIQAKAETIMWFTKAFNRMVSLVRSYYRNYKNATIAEDIEIEFKPNIPSNIMQDMIDARGAGFMMSQAQIAKRLPFSIDQEENAAELAKEADTMLITMADDNTAEQ